MLYCNVDKDIVLGMWQSLTILAAKHGSTFMELHRARHQTHIKDLFPDLFRAK